MKRLLAVCLAVLSAAAYCQQPFGWGYDVYAQCQVPTGLAAVAIDGGNYHSLALLQDGRVAAWGNDDYGQSTVPPALLDVIAVSAGGYHSLALKSDGTITGWGRNENGQCEAPAFDDYIAVSAGEYHSLALRANGSVVAWGLNNIGQAAVPEGLGKAKAISSGYYHSVVLLENGGIVAWGDNEFDQLAIPSGVGEIASISAGGNHTLAILKAGGMVAWGYNDYEQCDIPAGLAGVKAVAGGGFHSLALLEDGSLVGWGRSAQGQVTAQSRKALAVAGGGFHSLGIELVGPHMSLSLSEVVGGSSQRLIGTLTLSPPPTKSLVIQLTSSSDKVEPPAGVFVRAGSSQVSFRMGHLRTVDEMTYTLTANGGSYQCEAAAQLLPFSVKASFSANVIEGGQPTVLTVRLNARPSVDVPVQIASDDAEALGLAGGITIVVPAGSVSASRSLSTSEVAERRIVTVGASVDGQVSTADLTLLPKPRVAWLKVANFIFGLQRHTVTVALHERARAHGATLTIFLNGPGLTAPRTVIIPAGEKTGTFQIESKDVQYLTTCNVTISSGYSVVGGFVRIHPIQISDILLSPSTVKGGEESICTVNLNAAVAIDTLVELSSTRPMTAPVPASILIRAGSRSASFTIPTYSVEQEKVIGIRAIKNRSIRPIALTVTPR